MAPAKRSEVPVEPIEAGFRRVDPPAAWELGSDASVALFAAAAFETSPDALMLVEADGVIALANAAAEGMFGLSLSQLVGRGVETLLPERLRFAHKLHRRGFATAPRDRAMGAGRELAAVRANGEEFPVEIQLTPYEAHGRAFVVTMVRDVSERRKAEAEARERQWRLQIVLDQLPIVYWTTDCDLVYTSSIGAGLHELGLVENEAVGKPLTALFPSDDQHVEAHRLALTGVPTSHMIEYRGRLLHGHVEPYRDANGAIIGTVGSAYDLTEQKHALDAAAESERYARAVLDATTARTAVLDAGGHIVATNRAWRKFAAENDLEQLLGIGENYTEFVGTTLGAQAAGARALIGGIADILAGTRRRFSRDVQTETEAGRRWYVLVCEPLRAASGGALLTYTDITERKLAEKALARRALHDDLTGLPNRLQFVTRITSALNSRRRGGGLTALLFLDLDRFKIVNDDLGHATGDALLLGVAERLRATLRPGDTIGRFGGDEFVVLCEGLKRPEDALDLARRVIDALSAPIDLQGRQIHVTASIGVAVADSHERDSERLLANADIAMYAAKAVGRQAVMQFDESMHRTQIDRLEVEDDLRRAIAGGQLRLCYQPYVDIVTGEAVGAEALVRWHHPTRGILTPDEFISIAEQTGLIVPLGRWVLEEACRTLAEWGETGPLAPAARLAVNVSVHELTTPGFVDTVSSILAASGAEPGRLCFEITETAMMRDPATTAVVLAELHSCGVTIAVDDFGTGYASLAYLNIFPVQTVKIDRVFVEGLHRDRAGAAIIAGVVAIANGLDLTVIAEGVETREQRRQLRELGVHYAQGYLFGRPQEAAGLGSVDVQGEG